MVCKPDQQLPRILIYSRSLQDQSRWKISSRNWLPICTWIRWDIFSHIVFQTYLNYRSRRLMAILDRSRLVFHESVLRGALARLKTVRASHGMTAVPGVGRQPFYATLFHRVCTFHPHVIQAKADRFPLEIRNRSG